MRPGIRRIPPIAALLAASLLGQAPALPASELQLADLVAAVRRADYEGDRGALEELAGRLESLSVAGELEPAKAYWRGFTHWRRALNGFNEGASPESLETDLRAAVAAFEGAFDDPRFAADAKSGAGACWMSLAFMARQRDPETDMAEWAGRYVPLLRDAIAAEPDNPRVAWVWGAQLFYTPPEFGGGQEKALAMFVDALSDAAAERAEVDACKPPLEPRWGLPELMMNLAFFEMLRPEPNLGAAEAWARSALALVPNWHYVGDILLPQIVQRGGKE